MNPTHNNDEQNKQNAEQPQASEKGNKFEVFMKHVRDLTAPNSWRLILIITVSILLFVLIIMHAIQDGAGVALQQFWPIVLLVFGVLFDKSPKEDEGDKDKEEKENSG
jgi:hypothetical protein